MEKVVLMTQALGRVAQKDVEIKTALKIARILKGLNSEYETYEKLRVNLIKKYAKQKEGEEFLEVPKEKLPEFSVELKELLQSKIELELQTIKIEELGDIKISSADLMSLEPILLEETP